VSGAQIIKALYLTPFLVSSAIGRKNWSASSNAAKGAAGVTFVQVAFIFGLIRWIPWLTGGKLAVDIPKWGFYAIGVFLIFFNYYLLVVCEHGVRYQDEFRRRPAKERVLLMTCGIVIIGFSFTFLALSASFTRHL
jgi:hypothetical protein